MTPSEVSFRVGRKLQGTAERAGIGLARPSAPAGECGNPWVDRLPVKFDAERYRRAADRVLDGEIEGPEPSRHLHLVTLAQAFHLTGEIRYALGCRTLLDTWFEECPYPSSPDWRVSLQHAARLVNWSFAWFLLGADGSVLFAGEEGQAFRRRWLESIYQHCHFIPRHWSRHSSANNHLMKEAAGLYLGALTWPLWRESAQWARQARAELEREALAQTFADGVNKEQAIWYHHVVADLMLIAGLVARANGQDFSPEYWGRLEAMLEFIASVMDVGGNVPLIGDADEGVLVRFDPDPAANVFRSLLSTGAVYFRRPAMRAKGGTFDDKTRWLLGDAAEGAFSSVDASRAFPVRRAFPEGGYFVLGEDFETPQEVRLVADTGPLGYLAVAAHGHGDALAFTLSVAGEPILVDPGTFSYSAAPWRRYFRSTAAHNTVVLDDRNQSQYGGSFLWLRHASAALETFYASGDDQTLSAHHDGYQRLADPVRHRRTWRYTSGIAHLSVTDELLCAGAHSVAIHWHFAPECTVELEGRTVIARRGRVQVELRCPRGLEPALVSGREAPPLGWYSSRFDVKSPAATAVFAGSIQGNAAFSTTMDINREPRPR